LQQTIFYSWQSDLDAAITRNFIEEALKRAAKSIASDRQTTVEPVIDRDTFGVTGAPGISEAIFSKIDRCDVFVSDVSIINGTTASATPISLLRATLGRFIKSPDIRPTPNPNVLVELGYAAARLGWDRIILVQNTAFGSVEQLPFDLRGRRIVPYKLTSRENRKDIRLEFRQGIEAALRQAISSIIDKNLWKGKDTPRWFGIWSIRARQAKDSTLLVREVGARGFLFHISVVDGARTGTVRA
jgi:predicted nucleotide-binding protein